jgi:hypothetical protein
MPIHTTVSILLSQYKEPTARFGLAATWLFVSLCAVFPAPLACFGYSGVARTRTTALFFPPLFFRCSDTWPPCDKTATRRSMTPHTDASNQRLVAVLHRNATRMWSCHGRTLTGAMSSGYLLAVGRAFSHAQTTRRQGAVVDRRSSTGPCRQFSTLFRRQPDLATPVLDLGGYWAGRVLDAIVSLPAVPQGTPICECAGFPRCSHARPQYQRYCDLACLHSEHRAEA